MIDSGFFAKRVELRPEWLRVPNVSEICSVSDCISHAPVGWIDHWLHNGFGWFNGIADAISVVPDSERASYHLFAYRLYPRGFQKGNQIELVVPSDVRSDPIPDTFQSLGFDS